MIACIVLLWLALLALLLVALVFGTGRLFGSALVGRTAKRLCGRLCPIAIALALLGGIALGIWLCACGPELCDVLRRTERCVLVLLLLLLALIFFLVQLALAMAACPRTGAADGVAPTRAATVSSVAPAVLLVALVVLLFYLLLRCCGRDALAAAARDHCGRLLALIVLLGVVALVLRMIDLRVCRGADDGCPRIGRYLLAAILTAAAAVVVAWRCCPKEVREYELAMVGIWWDGEHDGEAGAHLRWAFRYGLPFPPGGFDLERRESGSSAWVKLNAAPIRPAAVFTDGNPAPGPFWQNRAVDRLPPSRWAHFQGPAFDELVAMVARPPFAMLFFVQEPDDPALPQPANPFPNQAARDAYLLTYQAATSPAHPVAPPPPLPEWRLEPMQALVIAALHPEIARLLGLYYIDKTAAPDTEYDYRITGHWADRDRSYVVSRLSRPRTQPLAAPVLDRADSPLVYPVPAGPPTSEDLAVGLRWVPPTADPDFGLTSADGIKPVRYLPRRKDLGARPCPAAPLDASDFAALTRIENDLEVPIDGVVVTPEENGADLVWPPFFHLDRRVDYRCYGYVVDGLDVFGRRSPASNVLVADVRDQTGPPPPLNVEAQVFQRADTATLDALPAAERAALFPPGSTHASVLRMSWVWPTAYTATVPDAKEFRVHHKIAGYTAFSAKAAMPLWPDPAQWDAAGVTIPLGAGAALPPRLVDAGVVDAAYYEALVLDPPMAPGDDQAVVYGFAGVSTVDHDPFNNPGPVAPPVVIFARDFVPPPPPPIPTIDGDPRPTDHGTRALVAMHWDADARYTYALQRVAGSRLPAGPAGAPPACLAAEAPTCSDAGAACVEARRRFALRVKAAAAPELLRTVTLAPGKPAPFGVTYRFTVEDAVDGTVGDDYLYAGRAIDAAGNTSAPSCPQHVAVRDFHPPRAPTVRTALGGEGFIRLTWERSPEADLAGYRVYRTNDPAHDGSLDRMTLVLEAQPDGSALGPPGAAAAVAAGTGTAYPTLTWTDTGARRPVDAYYRIVALDRSGNISALSAQARTRAVDTTPPAKVPWAAVPLTRGNDGTEFVRVDFAAPPGDADATFRIQRRDTGSAFWRPVSPWLAAGSTSYTDRNVAAGIAYTYRVQAMDVAGNPGEQNAPVSIP